MSNTKMKIPEGWRYQVIDACDWIAWVNIGISLDVQLHESIPDGKRFFADEIWARIYDLHSYHNAMEKVPKSQHYFHYHRMKEHFDETLAQLDEAKLWLLVRISRPNPPTSEWGIVVKFLLTADTLPRMSLERNDGRFVVYAPEEMPSESKKDEGESGKG